LGLFWAFLSLLGNIRVSPHFVSLYKACKSLVEAVASFWNWKHEIEELFLSQNCLLKFFNSWR